MKSLRKSNQGMTLVELLVSVAVLSLLMTGAFALMRQAATYHSNSAREVEIQNQLQTTFSQVSNLMIDSTLGIEYDKDKERLIACHNDFFYVVEKKDSNLYVEQVNYSDTATTKDAKLQEAKAHTLTASTQNLVSDRVATFIVDTSGEDDGYVVLAIRCTYNSRTAYLSQNVFLRNSDTATTIISGGGGAGGTGGEVSGTPAPSGEPTPVPSTPEPSGAPSPDPSEPSATPTPVPSTPVPGGTGNIQYSVMLTEQGSQYNKVNKYVITVINYGSETLSDWTVELEVTAGTATNALVYNNWLASASLSGNTITVRPGGGGAIAAGASVQVEVVVFYSSDSIIVVGK